MAPAPCITRPLQKLGKGTTPHSARDPQSLLFPPLPLRLPPHEGLKHVTEVVLKREEYAVSGIDTLQLFERINDLYKRALRQRLNISDETLFYDLTAVTFEGNAVEIAKKIINVE